MSKSITLERGAAANRPSAATAPARLDAGDDKSMLRAAANLTRDLNVPKPAIYWADLLGSALTGYVALFLVITATSTGLGLLAGLVAVLALYRAGSFIHELTHTKKGAIRGFRLVWNLIIGI